MGTKAELGIHWLCEFRISEAFKNATAAASDVRLAKAGLFFEQAFIIKALLVLRWCYRVLLINELNCKIMTFFFLIDRRVSLIKKF